MFNLNQLNDRLDTLEKQMERLVVGVETLVAIQSQYKSEIDMLQDS
jgi:septation ring formation regulator EzrA